MDTSEAGQTRGVHFKAMAEVLANPVRWQVLAALLKDELLPVSELARRVGQERSNLSKQMAILRKRGVVETWRGNLYRVAPRFRGEAEGTLDFGCAVLRLNEVK